jgi:hypothetical protein
MNELRRFLFATVLRLDFSSRSPFAVAQLRPAGSTREMKRLRRGAFGAEGPPRGFLRVWLGSSYSAGMVARGEEKVTCTLGQNRDEAQYPVLMRDGGPFASEEFMLSAEARVPERNKCVRFVEAQRAAAAWTSNAIATHEKLGERPGRHTLWEISFWRSSRVSNMKSKDPPSQKTRGWGTRKFKCKFSSKSE